MCLFVYLSDCLSVRVFVCLSVNASMYLPFYMSVSICVFLSICFLLSLSLRVSLPIFLSIVYSNGLFLCNLSPFFWTGQKQSYEETLSITYQPLSVFRVRPVTRCVETMPGHTDAVLHVSYSPDGKRLGSFVYPEFDSNSSFLHLLRYYNYFNFLLFCLVPSFTISDLI